MMKQCTTVKGKSITTPHQVASAVREKVIHGVHHNVDFPSMNDVDEMDVFITAVTDSTYHPAGEDLDVKPQATKKVQDVVLGDPVPSSTIS